MTEKTRILALVRGLPGSGKSTLAKIIRDGMIMQGKPCIHLEADQFFVQPDGSYKFNGALLDAAHANCRDRTLDFLTDGSNVVVSNTFTTHAEMAPYLGICQAINRLPSRPATIIPCVYECKNSFGDVHGVPEHIKEAMALRWEEISL